MGDTTDTDTSSFWLRYEPKASVRVQLYAAAIMWLIGAGFLLRRAIIALSDQHAAWWIVAIAVSVAVTLGLIKGRAVMFRAAHKSAERIRKRGRSCFFGFFSWKTWLLVALMMTGGILLRLSPLPHTILGTLYLAIAVGLIYGDYVFWNAAIQAPRTGAGLASQALLFVVARIVVADRGSADLAVHRLGQRVDVVDHPRVLVRRRAGLHPGLELCW